MGRVEAMLEGVRRRMSGAASVGGQEGESMRADHSR
jgi:hypothetical protein